MGVSLQIRSGGGRRGSFDRPIQTHCTSLAIASDSSACSSFVLLAGGPFSRAASCRTLARALSSTMVQTTPSRPRRQSRQRRRQRIRMRVGASPQAPCRTQAPASKGTTLTAQATGACMCMCVCVCVQVSLYHSHTHTHIHTHAHTHTLSLLPSPPVVLLTTLLLYLHAPTGPSSHQAGLPTPTSLADPRSPLCFATQPCIVPLTQPTLLSLVLSASQTCFTLLFHTIARGSCSGCSPALLLVHTHKKK